MPTVSNEDIPEIFEEQTIGSGFSQKIEFIGGQECKLLYSNFLDEYYYIFEKHSFSFVEMEYLIDESYKHANNMHPLGNVLLDARRKNLNEGVLFCYILFVGSSFAKKDLKIIKKAKGYFTAFKIPIILNLDKKELSYFNIGPLFGANLNTYLRHRINKVFLNNASKDMELKKVVLFNRMSGLIVVLIFILPWWLFIPIIASYSFYNKDKLSIETLLVLLILFVPLIIGYIFFLLLSPQL